MIFDQIRDRRAIVDRRRLVGEIAAIAEGPGDAAARRQALLGLLKGALASGRAEIRARFDAGASGLETATATAYLIDQIIILAYQFASERVFPESNPTASERLCVAAVGGYGRAEMAPFSDVDLLFLLPYKRTPHSEQVVEFVLYLLWDLGLKVGQATRSIAECLARARHDLTIRTSLLDARYIYGDQALFLELRRRFQAEVVEGSGVEFLAAKLSERDERHNRMGDSRYVVEPNIKDGKGGIRDLHTLMWIAKYLYHVEDVGELVARGVLSADEHRRLVTAQRFLWTIRCRLHYLADRAEERMTFDLQPEIARLSHYAARGGNLGVERFMKHYYLVAKDVGDLTRVFCAALEAEHMHRPRMRLPWFGGRREVGGFLLQHGRLSVADKNEFATDPVRMIELFHVAQDNDVDIHPEALRLIRSHLGRIEARLRTDPRANQLFVTMLTSPKDPETTLRRMNEAGVLGRFIPAFGRVVAQTQHDMYHVYTVDEHTIFAIGILSRIEHGALTQELPLASAIIHEVLSRKVLYLALFLHDIAKGRGGDHSTIGAHIALKLAPRLGFTREETETVAWLVQHHLVFSNTAFKRDIGDPKTLGDFVQLVQSPERLRLLLVLTVADIRAVGPKVWNGWKGQLLRELYYQAEAAMTGGAGLGGQAERVRAAQARLRELLADWPEAAIKSFQDRNYPSYWLSLDADTQARQARLVRAADVTGERLKIDSRIDRFRAVTELTLYAPDHPGLFAGVAGAMAVSGASIVDARIFTTSDGMALDTFWIQTTDGRAFDEPERIAKLTATITRTLTGGFRPAMALAKRPAMAARTAVFRVEPRVLIDNRASNTFTVIEVNARDRQGLLYDVTRTLAEQRLSIGSARISTYGERAVDVFYVKDLFGLKVLQPQRLESIKDALLAALADSPGEVAASRSTAAQRPVAATR